MIYPVCLSVVAEKRIRPRYSGLRYPDSSGLLPVTVRVPADSLRFHLSSVHTVAIVLLIRGRNLVGTSAVSYLTVPEIKRSLHEPSIDVAKAPEGLHYRNCYRIFGFKNYFCRFLGIFILLCRMKKLR